MKKEMPKSVGLIIAGVVVVAIIVAAIIIFSGHPQAPSGNAIAPTNQGNAPMQPASATGQKLSDSPYANYAYLISSDPLSSDARTALTGFKLSKAQNSDGSTTYTLTALKQGYQNQTYTVKSGQSLYFIERSLGDDNADTDEDNFLADDMAVVVDSNGVIVEGPGQA